jgi:hypothetical protein
LVYRGIRTANKRAKAIAMTAPDGEEDRYRAVPARQLPSPPLFT